MGLAQLIVNHPPAPRETERGFVTWILAGVRHRLLAACLLLFASPGLFGFFLWRASTAEKIYTTEVPLLVFDLNSQSQALAEILDTVSAQASTEFLSEPDAFLRGHHWQEDGNNRGVRYRYLSVLSTNDFRLATSTHQELVTHFAEFANDRYPGLRFAAGDEIAASNSLVIDDSAIRRNTRLSLICGASAYALGLTLLVITAVQVRWRFG